MAYAGCILRALWHSDYALLASFGSQCHRAECACYIAKSPANLPRSNAVERWLRISLKSLREKKFDSLIQLLCAICSKTNRLRQNARTLNFKLQAFDFQLFRVSDFKLFKCCLIVWPASGCRPQWSLDQRLWSDSVSSSKCPGVFQHGYSYSMVLTQTFKLFRSPAAIANLPNNRVKLKLSIEPHSKAFEWQTPDFMGTWFKTLDHRLKSSSDRFWS